MRSITRRFLLPAVAGCLGLAPLIAPNGIRVAAQLQPPAQRPEIRTTIIFREGEKITLDRGSQNGLRKGDKLQVYHTDNGKPFVVGKLVVTRVFGTTAEAKITEQNGTLGPEDVALLDTTVVTPAPRQPVVKAPKTPNEPTRSVPGDSAPAAQKGPAPSTARETAPSSSGAPSRSTVSEPLRKIDTPLPLLPQFSTDKTGGAAFTFEYTNDTDKIVDTSAYRLSAHLICDNQDYRTTPTTLTENYRVSPGKTRSFAFNMSDFTIVNDKDVWPLKSGRHTIVVKFGGQQYGPLTFVWRGDNDTK